MVIILNRIKKLFQGFGNLRWQLFYTYLLLGFLPLLFYAIIVSTYMEKYFLDKKDIELKNYANQIATGITHLDLVDEVKRPLLESIIEGKNPQGYRIIIVDTMALVVSDINKNAVGAGDLVTKSDVGRSYAYLEVMEALKGNNIATFDRSQGILRVAVSIFEGKEVIGAVFISTPVTEITTILTDVNQQLLFFSIPLAIAIIILVSIISRLIIEPMRRVLDVVKKMTAGHLNQRIPVRGHGEFAELAEAFNDMSIKLEQVDMTRNEFVSNVSHELKTPLSSVKVLSEALLFQENVEEATYREFLEDICSEVDRMTTIVNELLALVKLDRTENPLNIKPTNVNKMVEEILKRLNPLAELSQIELIYEDSKPVNIDADEMKLSLAISNLVENGIKYTNPGGSVKIIIDADHQNAFITISDTGIGIDEDDQKKVFIRFYRVDKTRDRETGGTGLGLSITHKTVLLHNGSIKLTSKPDEGSTFVVRLPIHQGNQPE